MKSKFLVSILICLTWACTGDESDSTDSGVIALGADEAAEEYPIKLDAEQLKSLLYDHDFFSESVHRTESRDGTFEVRIRFPEDFKKWTRTDPPVNKKTRRSFEYGSETVGFTKPEGGKSIVVEYRRLNADGSLPAEPNQTATIDSANLVFGSDYRTFAFERQQVYRKALRDSVTILKDEKLGITYRIERAVGWKFGSDDYEKAELVLRPEKDRVWETQGKNDPKQFPAKIK